MAKAPTTTTYTWPNDSLVRRIDVREQSDGRAVAYLYADESETARPQRQALRTALRQKGWGTLSDYRDGAYALRISGLKNAQELLDLLKSSGAAGAPSQQEAHGDTPQATSLGQSIQQNSLRLSGLIYMLGNIAYFMGGRAAGDKNDQRMALSFAAGDGLLTAFGGKDDARQLRSLLQKMKSHFDEKGIEVPKNASIYAETSNANLSAGQQLGNFMHNYINPIKISAEVVGGFFALRSGLDHNLNKGKINPYRAVGGAVVMGGWAAALLTKERKPDQEKLQHASFGERAIAYIQEKPLRLAGWAGLTFNALTFKNAWDKRVTDAGKWNLGAVGAMVSANGLYSISNKTVGGDIKTDAMVNDVYIVAAQILNKQPESLREAAIESTAKFLGERPEIKDTHAEVVTKLREQMSVQRESPWFEKTPLPAYTPQPKKPKIAIGREALSLSEDAFAPQPAATVDTKGLQHAGTAVQKAAAVTQAAAL